MSHKPKQTLNHEHLHIYIYIYIYIVEYPRSNSLKEKLIAWQEFERDCFNVAVQHDAIGILSFEQWFQDSCQ